MLGSMGIKTILSLVLGLMVLGTIISAATLGSIGDALQQGFDQIDGETDFTTEVEDVETLSDLTLFVRDRAMNEGCKIVEDKNSDGGYEGLEGTRLTATPECFGADASIIRGGDASPVGGADDNYMPGIYSREQFEVTETITIDRIDGNTWLEGDDGINMIIAGKPSYVEVEHDEEDDSIKLTSVGSAAGAVVGSAAGPAGTVVGAAIGATLGAVGEEYQDTSVTKVFVFFEGDVSAITDRMNVDSLDNVAGHNIIMNLCEGDKGYIQSNRGELDNDSGISSEEPLFPIIVIEELGDNCGNQAGRASLVPDETKTSGRMLHILSDTTEDYPYIGSHLRSVEAGSPGRKITDYSFHFKDFNENNNDVNQDIWGTSIQFTYNPESSNKCVIGLYDHTSGGHDSRGWVTVDQGHVIDYYDRFPQRSHPDVSDYSLEHEDDRPPGQTPRSARNLYDMFADDYDGVDGGFDTNLNSWEARSTELFYDDHAGEQQFAPYGDILCGEHDQNHEFNDHHAKWYMCSGRYIGQEFEIDGETWSCTEHGTWSQTGFDNPDCESDEKLCNPNTAHAYCSPQEIACLN